MLLDMDFLVQSIPYASLHISKNKIIHPLSRDHAATCFSLDDVTISIDSRNLEKGQLFCALKGKQVDGHDYLEQAIACGASGAIINDLKKIESFNLSDGFLIVVAQDPYQILVDLAKVWRKKFTYPVVGITGSIGKTSAKEMLRSIVEASGINAFVSSGTQNSTFGLPLNMIKMKPEHQFAVFEMGISEKNEMDLLVDMLKPSIGLITCIAHSHVAGIGNLADVAHEKRKIFKHFGSTDIGVVFGDQEVLAESVYHHPVAKFGFKTKNQVQARKVRVVENDDRSFSTQFVLKWYGKKEQVSLQGNHLGRVNNAIAASTVAYLLDIPFSAVVKGLQEYKGFEHRFELKHMKNKKARLISDCYNANPESMKAALIAFDQLSVAGEKIAVLGDMVELGEKEVYWHRQVGRMLTKLKTVEKVVLVGKLAKQIAATAPSSMSIIHADNHQEAQSIINDLVAPNDDALLLVKASRFMNFRDMVSALTK